MARSRAGSWSKRKQMARILVIDDDNQLRSLLRQILERENHVVLEASNGKQGTEVSRNDAPDIVIADLVMPEQDGLMAIQEILSQRPRTKVIAMSGGPTGNAAWLPIAKKAGALRVLKKPFQRLDLLQAVADALEISAVENSQA